MCLPPQEQYVSQLQTQIQDLERYITFLQGTALSRIHVIPIYM